MSENRDVKISNEAEITMTEGEVWTVKGLLHHDEFEVSFSDWDSKNPEQKARTFYEEQAFLINTSLTRQRVIRSWPEVIESKDGPETRMGGETGGPAVDAAALVLEDAAVAADLCSPDEADFYKLDKAEVGNWLRARAADLREYRCAGAEA